MKTFVKKWKYELAAAVILLVYLLYYMPRLDQVTSWTIMPYALSYRLGFISRGFVGSLLRLAIPMLTWKIIYVFILFNTIVLIGLVIFFLNRILAKCENKDNIGMLFIMCLFLVNPGSIAFLFYWGNFGRLDMFLIMSLIISTLLIIYDKCVWLVPILSLTAVMTHQAFTFQYYPALLVLLFYTGFIQGKRRNKIIFVITLLTTCAMFLYLQLFAKINYSYADTLAIIDATTDLPNIFFTEDMMVRIEYFSNVKETFVVLVWETLPRNIFKSVVTLVLLIPMIKIIVDLWKCYGKENKGFFAKILPWFILLSELPMFVLTCDYGRDYSALIISNFIVIMALYVLGDKGIVAGVKELAEKIKADPLKYALIVIICASIGKFQAAEVSDIGDRAYNLVRMMWE